MCFDSRDKPAVSDTPTIPTGTKTRKSQPGTFPDAPCGPNPGSVTASDPSAPAAEPTALYRPYTAAVPASSAASIVCSRVVAGPLSTTSVDSVPVRATNRRIHHGPPAATTTPATAMPPKNSAYERLRPTRSPNRPTTTLVRAVPAISAVSTAPACKLVKPRSASRAPSTTAVKPYPAARTPWPAMSSRASLVRPGCRDLTRSPAQRSRLRSSSNESATVVAAMQPRSQLTRLLGRG